MTKQDIVKEIMLIIGDETYSPGRYSEGVHGQGEAAKQIYDFLFGDYIKGKYQKLDPLHDTSEYESRGTILDVKIKQDSIEVATGWENDPTGQSERGKVTEVIKLEKPKDNS